MAYGFTYTLPTITGSHTDFQVVLKTADFPSAALNGANAFLNGGGNLRAYTSSAKTTQLPVEVVRLVTGASPDAEVWVKVPTAATSSIIYLEADSVETSQPAVTGTYGRNAVWSGEAKRWHFNGDADTGEEDATGSGTVITSYNDGGMPESDGGWQISTGGIHAAQVNFSGGDPADRSFFAVFKNGTLSDYGPIVKLSTSGGPWGLGGVFHGSSAGILYAGVDVPTRVVSASGTLVTGSVQSVYVTLSGTTGSVYVDGSLVESKTMTDAGAISGIAFGNDNLGSAVTFYEGGYSEDVKSADFIATFHNNQVASSAWGTVGTWADSGSGTDNLLADDISSASNLSQPTLSTSGEDALLADDIQSASTVSTATLGQIHQLLANDLSSATEVSNPSLSAGGVENLLADDLNSASSVSNPAIGQAHVLSANGLESASALSNPNVGQIHVILADDIQSSSVLSRPSDNTTWDYISSVVTSWSEQPGVATSWTPQTTTDTTWTIQ